MSEQINNKENPQAASEWDILTEVDESRPKCPEISGSYNTKKEDIPTDFFVDHMDRGERTVIFYGDNGETEIAGDYLNMFEQDKYKDCEELVNNPQLKSLLEQVALELSLVDATRGQIFDDDVNRYIYSESFRELLDYSVDKNTPQAEKDFIDRLLDDLSKQGNAVGYMMYRSQEDFPDTEEFRQKISGDAVINQESEINDTEAEITKIENEYSEFFKKREELEEELKVSMSEIKGRLSAGLPNYREIMLLYYRIQEASGLLESYSDKFKECGDRLRSLDAKSAQLYYELSSDTRLEVDQIRYTLNSISDRIEEKTDTMKSESGESANEAKSTLAMADHVFRDANAIIKLAKDRLGSVFTEVNEASPKTEDVREAISEIKLMAAELDNDRDRLRWCGDQMRDLGSEKSQLCYGQSDVIEAKTNEIKRMIDKIESALSQQKGNYATAFSSSAESLSAERADSERILAADSGADILGDNSHVIDAPQPVNTKGAQVLDQANRAIEQIKNIRIK